MTPSISVIIPTHNRAGALERLLGSLAAQAHEDEARAAAFEVILVADGCTDATADAAAAAAMHLPYALHVIETPGGSAAQARNVGAREAQADLLLFMDDDMEAMPGLIAAHLRRHRAGADRVVLGHITCPGACAPGDLMEVGTRTWWAARFAAMAERGHRFTFQDFFAGQFSVPRALFERAGGFDPVFAGAAGEDYELGVRLLRCGGRFCFAPEAVTLHHDHPSVSRALARAAAEGRGHVRMLRRHPALYPHFRLCEVLEGPRRERMWRWVWRRPRLARVAAMAAQRTLRLSERWRWRPLHRHLFGQLHTWAYWSGVKDELPTRAALQRFVQDLPIAPVGFNEVEVDLADGPARIERALAAVDADGVCLRLNTRPIGRIAPLAGTEPLRWRHLAALVGPRYRDAILDGGEAGAAPLAQPIFYEDAQVTTRRSRAVPRRTRVVDFELNDPADVIWGLEACDAVHVLVCRAGRPVSVLEFQLQRGTHTLPRTAIEAALTRRGHRLTAPPARPHASPATAAPAPVSVIVCTRDRPASLQRCLAALARLDHPAFEVVVVDNAPSDDRTRDAVADTAFRYVREPMPGLDWARNRGAAEARHELIAYLDDDAVPSRGWLRAIAGAFAAPDVAAVTGLVLPAELVTRAQHLFERYSRGMSKGLRPRAFRGRDMSPMQWLRPQEVGVGANLAVRRSVLADLGGFDTALDVGTPAQGGGDLDIIHRLLAAGHTIRYEPAAWVRHQHRRDSDALRSQLYANGRAFGSFLIKVFIQGRVGRTRAAASALLWAQWLVGRSLRAVYTKRPLPRRLVWAELLGAVHAPYAYLATRREDRRRRQHPAGDAAEADVSQPCGGRAPVQLSPSRGGVNRGA